MFDVHWHKCFHRPVDSDEWSAWQPHLSNFVESGYTIKPLLRSIFDEEAYRNVEETKIVSADLFAKQLSQLTQYRFTVDGIDGIDTDLYGLRGLFGGRGKDWMSNPSAVPTTTFSLVVQRLSEGAAYHATHDSDAIAHSSDLTLNKHQAAMIYSSSLQRSYLNHPTGEQTDTLMELWNDVYSIDNDPISAWQATLIYLFRHPYFFDLLMEYTPMFLTSLLMLAANQNRHQQKHKRIS